MASPGLRAYVVWTPILDGDDAASAREAAARYADPRARHYWDEGHALGDRLGRALALAPARFEREREYGVAWDVYLLYPRGVMWAGEAPRPSFWMHQLSQLRGDFAPRLDPAVLRARVEKLLSP